MDSNSCENSPVKARHETLCILWNPKFITVFTTPRHLSLSWAIPIHSWSPFHFSENHLNIILPSKPRCSKQPISLRLPLPSPTNFSPLPHVPHALLPLSSWFHHPNCRKLVILICALSTLYDFTQISHVHFNIQDPPCWLHDPALTEFPFYFKIKCSLTNKISNINNTKNNNNRGSKKIVCASYILTRLEIIFVCSMSTI